MELLYGTTNPAKLAAMRRWLAGLPVTLLSLRDLANTPPGAEETGANPLENARIKALHYRHHTGKATVAADSGLYIEGLAEEKQPGAHARRQQGGRMDDEEMIGYYAALVASLGGRIKARYRNAMCVAFPDGRIVERFDDTIASAPFYLVNTPHACRTKGFPLDSLSVDIQSGQYYFDMETARAESDLMQENGYRAFLREALGV